VGKGFFDEPPEPETPSEPLELEEASDPASGEETAQEPAEEFSGPPTADSTSELVQVYQDVVLSDLSNARSIFICGRRGSGKSYDSRILANLFMDSGFSVHAVLPVSSDISGCPHTPINSGEAMLETAYIHAIDAVTEEGRPACIVIDEVDFFCTPHIVNPALKNIINYGRHFRIWCVMNARRPARVHRDITSLMDCIIVHHISSEAEYRYISEISDDEFIDGCRDAFEHFHDKCLTNPMYKYTRKVYVG
jgi:hypothetical protein